MGKEAASYHSVRPHLAPQQLDSHESYLRFAGATMAAPGAHPMVAPAPTASGTGLRPLGPPCTTATGESR